MAQMAKLSELILKGVQELSDRERREVLNFIEFLKIKDDMSFIEYVNKRTQEAMKAKERGEVLTSLEELQKEYG